MRNARLVVSNTWIMWAAQGLQLVPQILLVPYLLKAVGEQGYGTFALVWSLMLALQQLQASLQSGVVKYGASFLAQNDLERLNRTVSASIGYSIAIGLASFLAILAFAIWRYGAQSEFGLCLIIVGITALALFPLTPFTAVIQSKQIYYVGAVADTTAKYLILLAVVAWFQYTNPSVVAAIAISAVVVFITTLYQLRWAYKLVPSLRTRMSLIDREHLRLVAGFGGTTVIASICLVVNSAGVRWLADATVSRTLVAHLAIMLTPVLLLTQLIHAASVAAMPAASAYQAVGDKHALVELLRRGTRYTTMLAWAAFLPISVMLPDFFRWWVGAEYVFLAPFAATLLLSSSFMLTTSIGHHMLRGLGHLGAVVTAYALGLALTPVLVIFGGIRLGVDPYVALTVGLSLGYVVCGLVQLLAAAKAVDGELRDLLKAGYAGTSALGATAVGLVIACERAVGGGAASRLVYASLSVSLFVLGIYFFVSNAAERAALFRIGERILGLRPAR